MQTNETEPLWAVVELLGHVRHAGKLSEEERFGSKLGRLDCPVANDKWVTIYFSGSSLYRLTLVSEEAARQVAQHNRPQPIHSYEMPETVQVGYSPSECDCPDDNDF